MRKIFILALVLAGAACIGQAIHSSAVYSQSAIPDSLLTDEDTYWTTATLASLGYVQAAWHGEESPADGMVIKLRFTKDNRFILLQYERAKSYGTDTETWTEVEGQVVFTNDARGQQVFVTKAEKGVCRIKKDGRSVTKTVRESELVSRYSNTYLWERINFPDDPAHTYLLTVDLDEHPQADIKVRGSIDRSWVTRFHVPVKK